VKDDRHLSWSPVPSQVYGGTVSAALVIEKKVKNFLCVPVEWLVRAGPFDRLSCVFDLASPVHGNDSGQIVSGLLFI
jgi:hypothetical protein